MKVQSMFSSTFDWWTEKHLNQIIHVNRTGERLTMWTFLWKQRRPHWFEKVGRLHGRDDRVNHISKCSKLAGKKFKSGRDLVANVIHRKLSKWLKCCHADKYYLHTPESVPKIRHMNYLELSDTNESPNPDQILFTNPSARAGYDTRSIFKRSLTGLNSGFFFLLD